MELNGHKAGFRVPVRTALLVFEGDYEGAEVRCVLDVPMGYLLDFSKLASGNAEDVRESFERFSKEVLLEWNLTDDNDKPVEGGLLALPPAFANLIVTKWLEAAMQSPLVVTSPA